MGWGLRLPDDHEGFEEGETLLHAYGTWRINDSNDTRKQMTTDNWPIHHTSFRGINLDCSNSVAGLINDNRGTGEKANVKAVGRIKYSTPFAEVQRLVREDPDTLVYIVALGNLKAVQ